VTVYEKSGVASWGPPDYGGDGELTLDRIAWEGGPDYWTVAKMTNAEAMGWSDPSFFPIGVFLAKGDTAHATAYQGMNFNTYLCMQHTVSDMDEALALGFSVIAQYDSWTPAEVSGDTGVVGWGWDEPEFGIGDPAWTNQVALARARADGRFMWTNWGLAPIAFWGFDPTTADVVGIDQYTYTSPNVREHFHTDIEPDWPGPTGDDAYVRKAATYGWMTERMNEWQGVNGTGENTCPNWVFFETKLPYLNEDDREIALYAEMKGAVWAALIHECRGVQWFDHNGFYTANEVGPGNPANNYTYNGGLDPNTGSAPDTSTHLYDMEQGCKDYVSEVNAQVLSLAPVLNTQSYVFDFGASGIDTMLKGKDGYAYIFAGVGLGGTTGSKTFTLTGSGIAGTTVEVVDESRSINVSGGQFTDSFANEYSYHIYKVAI
jgi:hypothetical protein